MRSLICTAALVLVTATATGAEPTNMFGIPGTCEKFTLDDTVIRDNCKDNLLQIIYDDGRVSLYSFVGNQIFAFSGTSERMVDGVMHQDIDRLVMAYDGGENMLLTVRGTCVYENPFAGPASFECNARSKDGSTFGFVFTSDGSKPTDEMAD